MQVLRLLAVAEAELIQVQAAVDLPPEEELVLDKELYEGDDD